MRSCPRQHGELGAAEAAASPKPITGALREGAGAGARISRRRPGGLSRPTLYRALQRAGRGDIRGPDLRKRDTVLAAVKAWPVEGGACGKRSATASLDCGCARRHWATAGRDEETALRSNKETDIKEARKQGSSRNLSQHQAGASTASKPARSP